MPEVFDTYTKKKAFLVCVDSDGCAMDTMDIKHYNCFGPCMVEEWGLSQWREAILKRWNEINLYSMTRGINRFKALSLCLKEISHQYKPIEDLGSLEHWAEFSHELSNDALREEAEKTDSICLKKALAWSLAVNAKIQELPEENKLPFEGVKEGLAKAHACCDVAIVSSANPDAVTAEWEQHGLMDYVDVMLAQNAGSKAYCIGKMLEQGYEKQQVLMVGDAPGDRQAAQKNGVLYYPILVRREKESWERFEREGLPKFLEGSFAGAYQEALLREFEQNLS
ncbi:MAG: HAD hydrolase-like protein [bacterium]|nr:HAD hydrolase-like protein [bacterium]